VGGRIGEHRLHPGASARLGLVPRAQRALGVADPGHQLVAERLELGDREEPRPGPGPGGRGRDGERAPRTAQLAGELAEPPLQPRHLRAQRPANVEAVGDLGSRRESLE
jgi:hypothetical protein